MSSRTASNRRHLSSLLLLGAAQLLVSVAFSGCASPGPPRAPSLQLPEPVRDLTAMREGDAVTVRFTLPERTTDGLPIREGRINASLCFGAEGAPCTTLSARHNVTLKLTPGDPLADRVITWTDPLPPVDIAGRPKLLAVRVRLGNLSGKSAGWSGPVYTASGATPQPVEGLRAEEAPSGILLHWQSAGGGEVLLRRESLTPPAVTTKSPKNGPVWLLTHAQATGADANETLDASATEDTPYRYIAVRREIVQLDGQTIELRSAASPPVEITWHNMFPPPSPAGLSAASFRENGEFAVDLVWEPVQLPGLKGYVVSRQTPDGAREQLTPQPIPLPAYHDTTAKPDTRYEYEVQAVSRKGIRSPSAVVVVAY